MPSWGVEHFVRLSRIFPGRRAPQHSPIQDSISPQPPIYLTRSLPDLLRPLHFHLLRHPAMEHKITFVGTLWLNKYFLLHGAFRRILLSPRWLSSLDVWTMMNLRELFLHQNPGSLTGFEANCSLLQGHKKVGFFIVLALMCTKPYGFEKWAPKQYNWLKERPGSWRFSYSMRAWQKELFSWGTLILGNLTLLSSS